MVLGGPYVQLFVPGPLPGLNEILQAASTSRAIAGTHKRLTLYSEHKKRWTSEVQTRALLERVRLRAIPPAHFTFLHFERDQRRDPDNFCGGAQKVLLDALKAISVLPDDGWAEVLSITHHWLVQPAQHARQVVGVQLYAAEAPMGKELALSLARPEARLVALIPKGSEARHARGSKRAAAVAR